MILISVVISCVLKIGHFVTFQKTAHTIRCGVFEEGSAPKQMKRVTTYLV